MRPLKAVSLTRFCFPLVFPHGQAPCMCLGVGDAAQQHCKTSTECLKQTLRFTSSFVWWNVPMMPTENRLMNRKCHVFLLHFICFVLRSYLSLLGRYVQVLVALLDMGSFILFHSKHRYLRYLKLEWVRQRWIRTENNNTQEKTDGERWVTPGRSAGVPVCVEVLGAFWKATCVWPPWLAEKTPFLLWGMLTASFLRGQNKSV